MTNESRAMTHLQKFAPLERFWIYRTAHTLPGLIHYSDQSGKAWTLMEDDEDMLDQCIAVLEARGCPIFSDIDPMDAYARQLALTKA
jgi:hypothetical protein